ncbi:Beta-glucuronosyltransferase glcat14b [Thalictrum thalictroides]|uniref:Beta-glucuronosyltransferase glcat14b n=1 Tax=Thalictrum thalictroides TaxID=46969 RepID=A0A7J6VEY1_THATH|nr:Beta-glucuronosyltransferase glcat14b [Thalictrum thalictroides]
MFGLYGPFHNVFVVGKADFAYSNAPSSISNTLHGASLLLRWSSYWHWFINLSASDYPLVTQDDLLHILSYLPKNFNFINHTNDIGSRELRRMKRISVDPGLYLSAKSEMFYATQKRELPDAYKLFTGSSSAILSREFVEFVVEGTNNLPRIVLMYFSNMPSSQANYFPTVLCNTREFKKTVINHNLHFASWDELSKQKQRSLGLEDISNMIQSGSAFGSGFLLDDPVLDHIDQKLLNRKAGSIVPGGWCLGEADGDSCTVWGDTYILRPGLGAKRLEKRLVELLSNGTFRSQQCVLQ